MPRPNKGKTKTVKQRSIYIYLPSIEMVTDWKDRVKKSSKSISKFVIERVEDSIRREEGEENYLSRPELLKQLNTTKEELKTLKNENRLLKRLVDNLDKELKRYRVEPFLEEDYRGVRRFDRELINLLRKGGSYTGEEILDHFNINPSEIDLIKGINKQLEILENYDLVKYDLRRWKWKV